jgi:UDP-N-acetylmuramate--alanine ligase
LQTEGIQINFDPNVDQIPIPFRYPENTLVVVTPAIPDDLPQLVYFRENGFTIKKRAEVLGDITRKASTICIAGTHGKTTTSTLTAHLLYQSHISCNAFLGGIANNYNSNLLLSKDSNFVCNLS